MKNLLFLLVMLTFLVACSNDDDNDKAPRNKYGQFLVDKIVCSRSSGHYDVFEFVYDSQNVFTKIMAPDDDLYATERNGSKITMIYREGADDEDVYQVYSTLDENECIVSMQEGEEKATFTYDASNRLISMDGRKYREFVWKENNLHSINYENGGEEYVFEYTEYPNNINFNFIYVFDEIFTYDLWGGDSYFGRPNQNLIKSYVDRWNNKYEFEYEFDGEKVTVVREYYVTEEERELEYTYRFYYK